MPKLKSPSSVLKRFKATGTKKVSAQHANRGHRKRFKSTRAKSASTQHQIIGGAIGKKIGKVL